LRGNQDRVVETVVVKLRHDVQKSFQRFAVTVSQRLIQLGESFFDQFHCFVSFHC
jgi:hypothetical protein